jgi:hypothetical protein
MPASLSPTMAFSDTGETGESGMPDMSVEAEVMIGDSKADMVIN